jgi:hypothetical protein
MGKYVSIETWLYILSLPPDPEALASAIGAPWRNDVVGSDHRLWV